MSAQPIIFGTKAVGLHEVEAGIFEEQQRRIDELNKTIASEGMSANTMKLATEFSMLYGASLPEHFMVDSPETARMERQVEFNRRFASPYGIGAAELERSLNRDFAKVAARALAKPKKPAPVKGAAAFTKFFQRQVRSN